MSTTPTPLCNDRTIVEKNGRYSSACCSKLAGHSGDHRDDDGNTWMYVAIPTFPEGRPTWPTKSEQETRAERDYFDRRIKEASDFLAKRQDAAIEAGGQVLADHDDLKEILTTACPHGVLWMRECAVCQKEESEQLTRLLAMLGGGDLRLGKREALKMLMAGRPQAAATKVPGA